MFYLNLFLPTCNLHIEGINILCIHKKEPVQKLRFCCYNGHTWKKGKICGAVIKHLSTSGIFGYKEMHHKHLKGDDVDPQVHLSACGANS